MKPWLRFPPPLHVLVLMFVLACSAISVIFKTLVLDRQKLERLIEREVGVTHNQVERLALLSSKRDEEARATALENHIAIMQSYPLLRWAAVCDDQGKVLFCTRPSWIGRTLTEVAPPQAAVLTTMAAASREPAHLVEERDNVTAARALPGAAEAPLQFTVLAERDLSQSIAQRERNLRRETLISSAMLLAYSLLLWLGLFVFLKWRLRDVYRKAGLTGKPARRHRHGGDEFAEIADVLGEAEHLLRDIGDNLQEVVWIVTPDLKPVYLSPAFEKIHLRKREEAYGNNEMPDYILEEHRDAVRDAFVEVIKGAPALHLEYRIKRGDGQVRWVETSGCPVRDADGVLQRIVGITRDITEQKALQEELVNASDQERHSLGHDLHDDACQRLAAMKIKCDVLAGKLEEEHSPQSAMAAELTDDISDTSSLLRNMARGLAPVEVEGDGLVHALQKLVRMQESIHEVPCFFEGEDTIIVESEAVATHLYRIAQEMITNAARHGKPQRIELKLESLPGHIRLTVKNDGRAFQQPAPGHLGMGLKIMRYRAESIGAKMDIRPRADGIAGTVAECTVPQDACLEAIPMLARAVEPTLKKLRRERETAATM